MGEKLKGASQAVSWEYHLAILRVALEHDTLSLCTYHNSLNLCTEPILLSSLSLLWVTRCKSQYPLHSLVHVMFCCCASVFKGSIHLKGRPSQISCPKTCVSPCTFDLQITSPYLFHVVDEGYIKALPRWLYSCRLQHIICGSDLETN